MEPLSTTRRDGRIPPPDPKNFAHGPESQAHKALKAWVARNPTLFAKFGAFLKAGTEIRLSSGDRLDVFFHNQKNQLAVEVKTESAAEAEIQRGVYQCFKYRATLQAMQLADNNSPNAQAVLVLKRPPPDVVTQLAHRLAVEIIIVKI